MAMKNSEKPRQLRAPQPEARGRQMEMDYYMIYIDSFN
jgi:hypothetical protein